MATGRVEWVRRFYTLLDKDFYGNGLQLSEEYFDDQSVLRMGNIPEIVGRAKFYEILKKQVDLFEAVQHSFNNIYLVNDDLVIAEGYVSYKLQGGKTTDPYPGCIIMEFHANSNFVKHYKAFVDQTPLFVQAGFDMTADEEGKMVMKKRV